jgi:hypothetical protein
MQVRAMARQVSTRHSSHRGAVIQHSQNGVGILPRNADIDLTGTDGYAVVHQVGYGRLAAKT